MSHGMEHWHPNPDFFFLPGGGPMLDLGPYYIANLINLIGPVRRVAALTSAATPPAPSPPQPAQRRGDPGQDAHQHPRAARLRTTARRSRSRPAGTSGRTSAVNMELYGTEGSLFVPDPNFFGGTRRDRGPRWPDRAGRALGSPLRRRQPAPPARGEHMANYRTAGLADMAAAITEGRDQRCSLDRTLHGVEVMTAVLKSGETGALRHPPDHLHPPRGAVPRAGAGAAEVTSQQASLRNRGPRPTRGWAPSRPPMGRVGRGPVALGHRAWSGWCALYRPKRAAEKAARPTAPAPVSGAALRSHPKHQRPNAMIRNPILPGFNPDPSICRVGGDYYIATSTFEWYPGVQIHHSTDLANWRLVARPLNRADLLDMRGNPDSCGVWAPCLSHADGLFWLVYTDVKRFDGAFKDAHNYITTCADDRRRLVAPHLSSTPRASTPRSSTTTMGGSGSSTCAGTIAAPAPASIRRMTASTGSSCRNGTRRAASPALSTRSTPAPPLA